LSHQLLCTEVGVGNVNVDADGEMVDDGALLNNLMWIGAVNFSGHNFHGDAERERWLQGKWCQ